MKILTMKMEVMQPQAKEYQQSSELKDARNRFCAEASRGSMALLTPLLWTSDTDFRLLDFRTMRK